MKKFLLKLLQGLIPTILEMLLPAVMEMIEKEIETMLQKIVFRLQAENTKSLNSYKEDIKKELTAKIKQDVLQKKKNTKKVKKTL